MVHLTQRFEQLSHWLSQYRDLWASQPYLGTALAWESQYPELSKQLRQLSDADLDAYEREAYRLPIQHAQWIQWFSEASELMKLESVSVSPEAERPKDIKARKWMQIHAFVDGVLKDLSTQYWIDWCGGKGHLIRSLAKQKDVSGLVLDRDVTLCEAGKTLLAGEEIDFNCVDVLGDNLTLPHRKGGIMALHACGQLTDIAIKQGLSHHLDVFALVPCCYHQQPATWQPSSELGRRWNIQLTRHSMRLPSLLEYSLRPRRQDLRLTQLIYRQAFYALFELAQKEQPLLPSLPRRLFYLEFPEFCAAVSEQLQMKLPDVSLQGRALQKAHERVALIRRQSIVHAPFRNAIELWINMDRALYLASHSFQVELKQLCPPSVTPRNTVIIAQRA